MCPIAICSHDIGGHTEIEYEWRLPLAVVEWIILYIHYNWKCCLLIGICVVCDVRLVCVACIATTGRALHDGKCLCHTVRTDFLSLLHALCSLACSESYRILSKHLLNEELYIL